MKLTCEHCGAGIDTDKDKKCPSCGAPYGTNKQYKEYHKKNYDYDLREREADIHSKELGNQIIEGVIETHKKMSGIRIIVSIFFIVIFLFIVYAAYNTFNNTRNSMTEVNNINNTIDNNLKNLVDKEHIIVSFNELAKNDNFEIKCDKITNYKLDVFEKEEFDKSNLKIYNFHIVFKNNKDAINIIDRISLTYTDEYGNENVSAKKHNANVDESKNQMELYVSGNLTYTGNVSFEIPKYVKDVKLVYKNVTIVIDDFKENI